MRASGGSWRDGGVQIGLIGEQVDLTYPVDYLGAGPSRSRELAAGEGDFAKAARRGQAAAGDHRAGGAGASRRRRHPGARGKVATGGEREEGWNGLAVLHTAAARVGGLDIGFVPGDGGHDVIGMVAAAAAKEIDVLFLLGADEIPVNALGDTFVVYVGTHGDAGAHRADVILPAAAYTEKSAIYVNTEGRVQMTARAAFPPGDAREDWAILRALSDVIGKRLPFDSLHELRRVLYAAHPHFMRVDHIAAESADAARALAGRDGAGRPKDPFKPAIADFYLTNAIAACLGGDGGVFRPSCRPARDRGGVKAMTDFFHGYVVPTAIVIGQSLLLMVLLLIFVAYLLYADRKIWAAVQMRRAERRRSLRGCSSPSPIS